MGTGGKDNGNSYKVGNNYSNGDYSSNSLSWRRKLDETPSTLPEPAVTEKKAVVSRATSPQPDSTKQVISTYFKTLSHFSIFFVISKLISISKHSSLGHFKAFRDIPKDF